MNSFFEGCWVLRLVIVLKLIFIIILFIIIIFLIIFIFFYITLLYISPTTRIIFLFLVLYLLLLVALIILLLILIFLLFLRYSFCGLYFLFFLLLFRRDHIFTFNQSSACSDSWWVSLLSILNCLFSLTIRILHSCCWSFSYFLRRILRLSLMGITTPFSDIGIFRRGLHIPRDRRVCNDAMLITLFIFRKLAGTFTYFFVFIIFMVFHTKIKQIWKFEIYLGAANKLY